MARRGRLDERVREVREGLEGLRERMGERGLLGEVRESSEGEGDREEERDEGDGEREMEEDEMIAYIHPFVG